MALLGFSCLHNMRVNLSIAIVAMVNGSEYIIQKENYEHQCHLELVFKILSKLHLSYKMHLSS